MVVRRYPQKYSFISEKVIIFSKLLIVTKGMTSLKAARSKRLVSISFCKVYLSYLNMVVCTIWYHLYNLSKHEKHSWRSITFIKVLG